MVQTDPTFRALIYETDALVGERARQMLRAEGLSTCLVDEIALFRELCARLEFDLFLVGLSGSKDAERLALDVGLQPLVLLAPVTRGSHPAHYRLTFPDATLLDRELRDPDALRRVVSQPGGDRAQGSVMDAVRRTFEPFGLSVRQIEVLRCALTGDTSASIAGKLFISELTVRNHLHAIYERVGVSGRRELLGRFVQGLIEANA